MDEGDDEHGEDHHDEDHHDETPATGRSTAPQSPYTTREVGIGVAIAVVGLVLVFGIPLALA